MKRFRRDVHRLLLLWGYIAASHTSIAKRNRSRDPFPGYHLFFSPSTSALARYSRTPLPQTLQADLTGTSRDLTFFSKFKRPNPGNLDDPNPVADGEWRLLPHHAQFQNFNPKQQRRAFAKKTVTANPSFVSAFWGYTSDDVTWAALKEL